jgi:hypothetical protein
MIFGATLVIGTLSKAQRILNEKSKLVLDFEFERNSKEFEKFDLIQRFTLMIEVC